jgi:hypothetical protein
LGSSRDRRRRDAHLLRPARPDVRRQWLDASLHGPDWEDEVAELIDIIRGLAPARVLDVACGSGFHRVAPELGGGEVLREGRWFVAVVAPERTSAG